MPRYTIIINKKKHKINRERGDIRIDEFVLRSLRRKQKRDTHGTLKAYNCELIEKR
jgi:hypothetical protein